jgi:hypothetical protein
VEYLMCQEAEVCGGLGIVARPATEETTMAHYVQRKGYWSLEESYRDP